jgi:hypothetical protein
MIQRFGFDSRHYQSFWEVGLEQGPLSLVSTIEELLERKRSGSGLETEITSVGDPPRWLRDTPLSAKVGTSFADSCRLVGIVRLRTQATELICFLFLGVILCWRIILNFKSIMLVDCHQRTTPKLWEGLEPATGNPSRYAVWRTWFVLQSHECRTGVVTTQPRS